jgi:serine/threonine protein kinase
LVRIGEFKLLEHVSPVETPLYTARAAVSDAISSDPDPPRFWLKIYEAKRRVPKAEQERWNNQIERDALALSKLNHRHVVRVARPFRWNEDSFVVPHSHVEGRTLRELLDDGSLATESVKSRLGIAQQIGRALEHAHEHGVIHRDARPENVIIAPDGEAVLTHFDLARVEGARTLGSMAASWFDRRYTAPELWGNPGRASPASDQYALGMVVLELLAATSFRPGAVPDLALWQPNPALSDDERKLALRLCALRIEQRYPTLGEALDELSLLE